MGTERLDDVKSIKEFAINLAREVGEIQRRHLGQSNQIEYKGAINMVTLVDRLAEEVIAGRILERFPDHNLMAEEGRYPETDSAFRWYVDPLDGTTNYIHGYPCFCVSMGLGFENEVVMGVVYDPMRDEMFCGTKGGGALLNGKALHVSETGDLDHSLLSTGFSYDIRESHDINLDYFVRFCKVSQGVRRIGSAALDLCYVASGRFDGFWEMELSPWDCAAGILLVREAGGKVTDLQGDPFRLDSGEVLATNGLIHGQMVSVLDRGAIQKGNG